MQTVQSFPQAPIRNETIVEHKFMRRPVERSSEPQTMAHTGRPARFLAVRSRAEGTRLKFGGQQRGAVVCVADNRE